MATAKMASATVKQNKYVKQDPITHILKRPDMYVGSKIFEKQNVYVYSNEQVVKKCIDFCPALVRTFVEIVSNAVDNLERDEKMTYISVNLTPTECEIKNDGSVIPIESQKVDNENIYNHSLIFGHLLSGENYDDSQKRFTSGRNGLGAKLTNVLSTSFTVEGVDPKNNLKLVQTWTDNMRKTKGPKITKSSRANGYTLIKWEWDLDWFGIKKISNDILDLFAFHLLNAAMITGLKISLNGIKLPNKFNLYFNLFQDTNESELLKLENEHSRVLVSSSDEFEHISFVNGIQTKTGGKHVSAWVEAVCRPIVDKLRGKGKNPPPISIKDVKNHFKFLIIMRIPNPEFESQEKNELKTNVKVNPITPAQVTKILKWSVGSELKSLGLAKEKKQVAKTMAVSSKQPIVDGYDKANYAGGVRGKDCTLILCEGLSAKTFAVDGISKGFNGKKGRDWFGIYPLRGKLLNTRNASPTSIKNNAVITNLIKILGLNYGQPDKLDKLNYGKVCIITDADVDGIHIEGLLLNFFDSLFPELIKRNFITSMKTPILRIGKEYYFDEKTAIKALESKGNKSVKYYKGLGAIEPKETESVFGIKMLQFNQDKKAKDSFTTAFDKLESSERKMWLENYLPNSQNGKTLDDEKCWEYISFDISRHLNEELIKFFHDDCKRSIPSALDGLKESQRKIIYTAKKCNIKTRGDIKVAQFGGEVAKHTNYHHGEENLFKTIIKMAQSFTGSNNIPILKELGRFGTRLEGGEDAASPRYIKTNVVDRFDELFNPNDDNLLELRKDDGDLVEPCYYVPVIPLILVNGCVGIGTGWMCNIPQFNPKDVIRASKLWMEGDRPEFEKAVKKMVPWYNGFTGEILKTAPTKFQTKGTFTEKNGLIKVTELPIGLWNSKFQKMLDEKEISYNNRSTPTSVLYEINNHDGKLNMQDFEKKMCTSLNLDNIVVFDRNEKIVKVDLIEIFDMWGKERLSLNLKRKQHRMTELNGKHRLATCKSKFIQAVRNKEIILTDSEERIVNVIKEKKIAKEDSEIKILLDMPVRSLTKEKQIQLEKQIDEIVKERKILLNKTSVDIWTEDINMFE